MAKYGKCSECGKEAVHLATASVISFLGDMDDREGGRSEYWDVEAPIDDGEVCLFAHICFECGYLEDVGIESPRDRALNTSTRELALRS